MSDVKSSQRERVRAVIAALVEQNPGLLEHWLTAGEDLAELATKARAKKSSTAR